MARQLLVALVLLVGLVSAGRSEASNGHQETSSRLGLGVSIRGAREIERSAGGDGTITGTATHYCRTYTDCPYEGRPLGCGLRGSVGESTLGQYGDGLYHSADPTIVAVGPERYGEWPCGTRLRVCARLGSDYSSPLSKEDGGGPTLLGLRCIGVVRVDSCPGCGPDLIDMSEAGFETICGDLSKGVCAVTIEAIQ